MRSLTPILKAIVCSILLVTCLAINELTQAEMAERPLSVSAVVQIQPDQSVSEAISQAAEASAEVYLSAGEYVVKTPIQLPSGCRLIGAGPRSVLRIDASAKGGAAFVLQNVTDVAISNLMVDGSAAEATKLDGIRGSGLERFVFENIQFQNIPGRAINIWGGSRDGTIRNCTCIGTGDRAIVLGGAKNCTVEGCVCRDGKSHGIWVLSNSQYITVTNNNVYDNRGQGIEVFKGCENCIVSYNRCARNSLGIHCHTVRGSILLGNILQNNRSNGIDCNNCEQMRIIGNHSEFSGSPRTEENASAEGSGILLYRTRDSLVVGNISINNDQGDSYRSGIQLMDAGEDDFLCTRNVVTGNVCLDDQENPTQQVGIRIGRIESKCPDNLIVANSLGRHPNGPFGGNRRGAAATAHNWTGDFPEDHAPVSPLIPVVGELPEPEARWHGRLVLLTVNDDEIPYVCRRKSGKLEWATVGQ